MTEVVCSTFCQEYEYVMKQPSRILFGAILQQQQKYGLRNSENVGFFPKTET